MHSPDQEYELHIVEIQYGILQLSEALDFLHSDAKMLHGNITPESVAVTSKGSWKLMGFNFSSFSQYQSEAQVHVRMLCIHCMYRRTFYLCTCTCVHACT